MGHFSLIIGYGQEKKKMSIGIDTLKRIHLVGLKRETAGIVAR